MSKDPAFLFYTNDFLSGISDLTMEERGQFITLLCLQHQKGRLTEKMITISCGNAAADVMKKFEKDEEGLFYNIRLDKEIKKRAQHAEKQRQRALKGWEKRKKESKLNNKSGGDATALPLEDVNVNENKDIILVNGKDSLKGKPKIPNFKEFFDYAISKKQNIDPLSVKLKYDSWIESGWMTGGKTPRKIKNWKSTLLNTIPHLKEKEDGKQVTINRQNQSTIESNSTGW